MVAREDSKEAPPKCRNCAGLLYFSSLRHSQARNPLCLGLSRAERNAKHYTGEKLKRDPGSLLDLKYACIGYSIHNDARASSSTSATDKHLELPLCMGIEIMAERRMASQGGRNRHTNNMEDPKKKEVTPIKTKPPSAIQNSSSTRTLGAQEFSARFIRNAGLVASGVVKNLSRLGNSMKTAAMDIFHSDRDAASLNYEPTDGTLALSFSTCRANAQMEFSNANRKKPLELGV